MNSITLSEERDEETCYGYCDDYQPHAVKRMFDHKNEMLYDMRWDEAGNLGQVSMGKPGEMFEKGRFLFWTEDNRMHAAVDDKYFSYYVYDHSGERRLKLTGINKQQDVNADLMATYTVLNEPTLYPSSYMVLNNKGYTKHYYAGTERVAARLGGGGLNALQKVVAIDEDLQWRADKLFKQSLDHVNHRVLGENDLNCIMRNKFSPEVLGKWIEGIPYQVRSDVETEYWQFKEMVNSMLDDPNNGHEKEVFFYHSDHLGSASWITDGGGMAVQHIQYLPYGEPYINQRPFGYSERFTFTGKERDEETGYGYFGARYMDHELMTMWLSVDPMADKYPSISPYAYCAWNPVNLVDPDGRDWYKTKDGKMHYTEEYTSKEKFQKSGIKGEYLGKTATVGSKYYSLFGQVLDKESTNGQITMKIDQQMISYAKYSEADNNYKWSIYNTEGPSQSSTDFKISSVAFDGHWGTTHQNIHGPKEMGTYADMADIYYYVNGGGKDGTAMKARFDCWKGATCITGRNGNFTTPTSPGEGGKLQRPYLTFKNGDNVIVGLNFHSDRQKELFKNKFYALFPEIKSHAK